MNKMTLSEAIRLGAMMKPQAFNSGSDGGSCALRAAHDALGLSSVMTVSGYAVINYSELAHRYPMLHTVSVCPHCGFDDTTVSLVWHLNDQHHWTRERIADWIDSLEQPPITAAEVHAAIQAEVGK